MAELPVIPDDPGVRRGARSAATIALDAIRLKSGRRLAISTIAILLCAGLVALMPDLRAVDLPYLAIVVLSTVTLGYLAATRRHDVRKDLCDASDAATRTHVEAERADTRQRVLRGIIPICSHCHRVRIEDGILWEPVDVFVSRRTDAAFSHGVCPDCLAEHYPKLRVE